MSRSPIRATTGALVLSTVALAALPAASQADPTVTRLTSERAIDVSSDGRYVLLQTGAVLDRTTGTTSEPVPGTPIDLAVASPKVLYNAGGKLYVKDPFGAADGTLVSLTPAGAPLEVPGGQLIRNGAEVVFVAGNAGGAHTIEVGAAASTLAIPGASSARASEDGRVITFSKPLPPVPRPAGLKARNAKATVEGVIAGYSVDGGAPRRIGVTKVTERLGAPSGAITCATNTAYYQTITPTLQGFTQDGLAGGRYQFVPATTVRDTLNDTRPTISYTDTFQDPVSGAYASIFTTHGGAPVYNAAGVTSEAGIPTALTYPPSSPENVPDVGFATRALPFSRGAGAILVGTPRGNPGDAGTFVVEGIPTAGDSVIPWTTLPRTQDPLITGDEQIEASWATCQDPAPPVATDYVTITPKLTGNSAGTITLKPTPPGRPPVRSLTATVSWYGIRTWARTTTTGGTTDLPAVPVGIPGFKVTAKVTLADGSTATTSAALRRTR